MNSTSFFYNHASQWRYEKLTARELLSPLVPMPANLAVPSDRL